MLYVSDLTESVYKCKERDVTNFEKFIIRKLSGGRMRLRYTVFRNNAFMTGFFTQPTDRARQDQLVNVLGLLPNFSLNNFSFLRIILYFCPPKLEARVNDIRG